MATFKAAIVKTEQKKSGNFNIKIRISHDRKTRYIATDFFITENHWDETKGCVLKSYPNSKFINIELQKLLLYYEQFYIEIKNKYSNINIQELLSELKSNKKHDLFDFIISLMNNLKSSNPNTYYLYNSILSNLKKYSKQNTVYLEDIDYNFLNNFVLFLTNKNISLNSQHTYLNYLKIIYNKAIYNNLITYSNPFKHLNLKRTQPKKKALTIDDLKLIKNIALPDKLILARDIFLLSFYMMGINLVDLFNLKPNIYNNTISYNRKKTNKPITIYLEPEILELIEKYKGKTYLFNFAEIYKTSFTFYQPIFKGLRKISKLCGFQFTLSTYYARHTWATIANNLDINTDTIAHALSHSTSITMTNIYINFNIQKIFDANRKVIDTIL